MSPSPSSLPPSKAALNKSSLYLFGGLLIAYYLQPSLPSIFVDVVSGGGGDPAGMLSLSSECGECLSDARTLGVLDFCALTA